MDVFDQTQWIDADYGLLENPLVLDLSDELVPKRMGPVIVGLPGSKRSINPTRVPGLHYEFLRTQAEPDRFLAFARKYGLLFGSLHRVQVLNDERGGEPVSAWTWAYESLKLAVRALQAASETAGAGVAESRVTWHSQSVVYEDQVGQSLYGKAYMHNDWLWSHLDRSLRGESARTIARFAAQSMCNKVLTEHVSVQLLADGRDAGVPLRLFIRPKSLWGAMWSQFARTIDDRAHVAVCEYCGNVFEAKRSSAKYCPEELGTWCRKKAQRQPS